MHSDVNEELALEHQALFEGKERYLKSLSRLEEDQGYASRSDIQKVVKGCIPLVSKVLKDHLELLESRKTSYSEVVKYLKLLDTDVLALIGLQAVFGAISKQENLTNTCSAAGRYVENELWAMGLQNMDRKLLRRLIKRSMEAHGSVAYRRKAIRSTAAKEGYSVDPWPNDLRISVGSPIISAVLEGCDSLFKLESEKEARNMTVKTIVLTEEASTYIASITEVEQWMHPKYKPMIVPPKRWTTFWSGCYLSEALSRNVPLVRVNDKEHRDLIREAIDAGNMQPCLFALNSIQETGWRINQRMLEIVKWAYDQGVSLKSFPSRNDIPRPPRPDNWETLDASAKKAWRIKVSQVVKRNRGMDGERIVFLQDMAVAEELKDRPYFALPHSMDFRGRVYPIPHFNNQRADHVKSLFEFAEGLPIGIEGLYWLRHHVANCGDFEKISKRSLDERVQWCVDNEEMLLRVADDPFGTFDIWSKADKPFCFVAAVIDYANALRVGPEHVSRIPIALDGSNSGLQHYSAALRSEEGALVNLVPTDKPSDVYQVVCDKTIEILKSQDDEVSKLILANGVTRSLVKRNVMTFAYSSEQFGFAEQHRSDLMAPLQLKVLEGSLPSHPYAVYRKNEKTGELESDDGFKASMVLAKAVWTAVNQVVKDASRGMRFFQQCAGALAHERKGLMWVTPVGLPVLHKYSEYDMKKISLFLYDKDVRIPKATDRDIVKADDESVIKRVQVLVKMKPNKHINKEKAKSAVAPNIIHAQDSSHLMMVVNAAKEKGINSFSLIHDSFGTHAANTTEFFYTIREQFVDMYEEYCPFEEIRYQTAKALKDKSKVPNIPEKGNLDIRGVIDSLYAFA